MVVILLVSLAIIIALFAIFTAVFSKTKSNEEPLAKRIDTVAMLLLAIFLLLIALLSKLT